MDSSQLSKINVTDLKISYDLRFLSGNKRTFLYSKRVFAAYNKTLNLILFFATDLDGYGLVQHSKDGDIHYSMYSPKSVVEAMLRHKFGTYWNQTETYEALKIMISKLIDEGYQFVTISELKKINKLTWDIIETFI